MKRSIKRSIGDIFGILGICCAVLLVLAIICAPFYVALHFIVKFW